MQKNWAFTPTGQEFDLDTNTFILGSTENLEQNKKFASILTLF
jgi:hypothetical protein